MSDVQNLTQKRWITLIAACIINIMIGTGYAWSMFSPALAEHFGGSNALATLTWAFTLANSLGPIPMIIGGRMNDTIGPKWSIIIGGILFGGGVFIAGCATSPIMVVIGYGVIMGLGMGFVYSSTIGNTIKLFPDKAGLVGGLTTATYGLGSVILPMIINNIVTPDTVLNVFKVLGVIYLVVIVVGGFIVTKAPVGFRPDGWVPPAPKAGVKAPEDKTPGQMLKDPIFWVMMLLMLSGALFGLMLISNCRMLVTEFVGAPEAAALTVTLLALFNALGRVGAGTLSDKLGRVNTLLLMLIVGAVGLLLLTRAEGNLGLFRFGVCLVGLGFGAFMGVYPGFCAGQFGMKNNGTNYGIMFIGFALAGIIGPRILLSFGDHYTTAFMVAFVIAMVGVVMTFVYRAMNKAKA